MERSEWHAELAEILHPAGDLARDSLSYTHEKANDLKEALVTLLKQADATWPVSTCPARHRSCISWAALSLRRALGSRMCKPAQAC